VLKKHRALEKHDTRFRAGARLLQALWRECQGLPIGLFQDARTRRRKIGSLLGAAAAEAGRNFMSPEIAYLVRREVAYQETGALIERNRLYGNLLSSMPLAFNLFGPLCFDLALAAKVMRALLPHLDIAQVRAIRFEHSPGRREPGLTGDRSSFDVAILYQRGDGAPGLIAIEVKYSETLAESGPIDNHHRYDTLAHEAGVHRYPGHAALRVNPMQQLFREHLLAQAAVMQGRYAEATFIVLAPRHNHLVQRGAELYASFLSTPVPGHAGFLNVHLEQFIDALGWAGAADEAFALYDRYLDWSKIDAAVDAALRDKPRDWRIVPPAGARAGLLSQAA
jgi:hypothetical protein